MTQMPADAPRSEDGQWWWDGSQWQPVVDQNAGAAASGSAPGQSTPAQGADAGAAASGSAPGQSTPAPGADPGAGQQGGSQETVAAVQVFAAPETDLFEEAPPAGTTDDQQTSEA